jgi:hypothetical protein
MIYDSAQTDIYIFIYTDIQFWVRIREVRFWNRRADIWGSKESAIAMEAIYLFTVLTVATKEAEPSRSLLC